MRRVTDFARGSHVPAATLNAVQDEQRGLVGATGNPSGALALKGGDGRYVCTPDAGVPNGQLAVLDSGGIDWKSRLLSGVMIRLESAAQRLHGADAWQANDTTRPVAIRRFEGRTGSGAVGAASATVANGTPPVIASGSFAVVVDELATAALRVYLYARPSDGALCVYNASGATLHAELFVEASAAAPTPGVTPPTPIPTLTNLLWLTPTVYASRPSNPGADVRGVHRSTDTGEVALWDGGAWRVLVSSIVNATQLQGRDVASTAPTNGQTLAWNHGASRWEPTTISGGSSMPTAAAADEIPLATGAGTNYTARSRAEVREKLRTAAFTWTFAGGSLDYTAQSAYAPAGATSANRDESALLGDGTSVPYFSVYGRDKVAALDRTTAPSPSLRVTLTNSNGEPLLRGTAAFTESGTNLLFWLPESLISLPKYRIDATIATNIPGATTPSGSDFMTARLGLLRWNTNNGTPETVCVVDNFCYGGTGSGAAHEACTLDGASASAVNVSSTVSGGVVARDVRITVDGPHLKVETCEHGGSLSTRRSILDTRRRTGRTPYVLALTVGQVQATPLSNLYVELRALTITPL